MKIGTLVGFAFVLSVAVGFSYCAGYAHGRHARPTPTVSIETPARPEISPPETSPPVAGMSRDAIVQALTSKTWYSHWEARNRDRPAQFRAAENGQIQWGKSENPLTLELRWVLNQGGHMFVPINEKTIHGFYIPTGRQKGFFADQ